MLARHAAGDRRYHLLPGGGVDRGETLEAALVREVLEETGLEVAVGDPVLLSDTIAPDGARHVINITFRCEVTGGALGTPRDPRVEAVDVVEADRLGELDLRPPMADAIGQLLSSGSCGARYLGSLYAPEHPAPGVT